MRKVKVIVIFAGTGLLFGFFAELIREFLVNL